MSPSTTLTTFPAYSGHVGTFRDRLSDDDDDDDVIILKLNLGGSSSPSPSPIHRAWYASSLETYESVSRTSHVPYKSLYYPIADIKHNAPDFGLLKFDNTGKVIQFAKKPKGEDCKHWTKYEIASLLDDGRFPIGIGSNTKIM
ncbi:hypothetical protein Tco_1381481 [Tanacetum coccineum]